MKTTIEALAPYYKINFDLKKTLVFTTTHTYTLFRSNKPQLPLSEESKSSSSQKRDYWNKISEGLYLGQLPVKNLTSKVNQAEEIKKFINSFDPKRPFALVISILEYLELAGIGLTTNQTVTPFDWKKIGIEHHHLLMSDFGGEAPFELIVDTVMKIKKSIDKGHSVFLHCKAGKGRSALIVLIYLVLFGDGKGLLPSKKIDDALLFLKSKRTVGLNDQQLKKAVEIVEWCYQNYSTLPTEILENKLYYGVSKEDIDNYFATFEAKNAIRHLDSFKEMAIYATKNLSQFFGGKSTKHIQKFFDEIYQAKNAQWYIDMVFSTGSLENLLLEKPLDEKDLEFRKLLINQFKDQVTQLLTRALSWNKEEIHWLIRPQVQLSSC